MEDHQKKISFQGLIRSVQPRATVWRYKLDNRTHRTTGYNLFLAGVADGEERDFVVAISEKQFQKFRFHIGDRISGTAWTRANPKLEYADYYRTGALKKLGEGPEPESEEKKDKGPWTGEAPELSVYDWRGCRMLASRSWSGKCFTCKWACMSSVTIEYNFGKTQKFRFESFCYGPLSCSYYRSGPKRAVPYKGESGLYDEGENGWLDQASIDNRLRYLEDED